MVGSTVVVMMCSIIMIMPVYNALALGKFDFSVPDYSFKTMFNPIELVACMLPNQYYSVNVDTGTGFYGRPEIYCGVLTFMLLPMYAFNKKIKANRKIGHGLLLFVLLFSMYIKPINMLWHGGQDPNWLPYRYSFILSFIMVSMAAEVFSKLDGYESETEAKKSILPLSISAGIVAVLTLTFTMVMNYYKNYKEKNGITGYSIDGSGFSLITKASTSTLPQLPIPIQWITEATNGTSFGSALSHSVSCSSLRILRLHISTQAPKADSQEDRDCLHGCTHSF